MHRLKEHMKKQHPSLSPPSPPKVVPPPPPKKVELPKLPTTCHQPEKSPVLVTTSVPQFVPILSLVQAPTGQIYLLNTNTPNQLNYVLAENTNLLVTAQPQTQHLQAAEKSNIRVSTGKLDIDLSKSQQQEKKTTDIVASALVTSRVLKSC